MANLSRLANQLSNLTVFEAAELAKKLQARWDLQLKRRPALSFNEGKVCDAIVRRLEEREQQARAGLRWPEQENHKSPVEVAFMLGDQLYALEHTGIEPFEGHLRMDLRNGVTSVGNRTDRKAKSRYICRMPSYSIRIHQGEYSSASAVDLPDDNAARREVSAVCEDLIRDIIPSLKDGCECRLEVANENATVLRVLRLNAQSSYPK
jgi:hypothetical protein